MNQPSDPHSPQDTPARTEGARRCAGKPDGSPCGGYAIQGSDHCFAHSPAHQAQREEARRKGQQRSAEARREKAEERQAAREQAQMGTRDVIAKQLGQRHDLIRAAVDTVLQAAAAGDLQAARVVMGWIDQGHGKPAQQLEVQQHASIPDEELSTALSRWTQARIDTGDAPPR